MNQNKVIGIILIICMATTFLSVVSAVDVDIEGVKFNIPDGYEENKDQISVVETNNNKTTFKFYFNDNGDGIAIGVISSDDKNLSLPSDMEGYVNKTINGIDGFYDEESNVFAYEMDGKLVEITTTDIDLLKDVILK